MIQRYFKERWKEVLKDNGFRRYFSNTGWMLGEKVLQIFASLFVGVWVARYLGPNRLGILSYAQSYVAIFLAFSTLGLNGILVRELVKTPNKTNFLLGTTFILQTCGSIFLMVGLIAGLQLTSSDSYISTIILILGSVTFLQSFYVIGKYFESVVKSRKIVVVNILGLSLSSIIKIVLILSEASLMSFVYLIVFDAIFITGGLIYLFKKNYGSILEWKVSIPLAKKLLADSWPLILSGIVVSIYMKIDQIMIKEIMDNDSVGQYAAAVRLSEAWYFIPTVITNSLFPAIVNAKKIDQKLYYGRLQNLYDLMVLISLGIALPMTFLSDFVVNILYGSEFNHSADVLKVHIWAGIFVFLGVSRGGWILNENLQRFTALYLGIGMIANILMNYFLIPDYGINGAAFATLISQSISVLFAPLLFRPTRISFYMMIRSLFFINLIKRLGSYKRI